MDKNEIIKLLDYALLTDEEMLDSKKWIEYSDELPKWFE
jgi:hypothetical protein